jgi:chromosome segregation ATPase
MSNTSAIIKRIAEKVATITKQQQSLKKENSRLQEELTASNKKNKELQQKLEDLSQQISVLKLNASSLNEADKKELEKRINQYVKEIDRCIAWLGE